MNHLDNKEKDFSRRRNDGHEFFILRVVAAVARHRSAIDLSRRAEKIFTTEGEKI
jgi:hypothetical protein